jgi:hypothetical protein
MEKEPAPYELLLMQSAAALCFGLTLAALQWQRGILGYGDNVAYLEVATAIRHWDFRGIDVQHFMGYPYAIALISLLFHLPLTFSLWIVAIASSFISMLLIARLFGSWVAAYFAFSNFAWLQLSFMGGSEPLAVALGMGAFWSFRRDRVPLAVLLASLATIVRPLMLFVLLGIGIALLRKKRYAQLLAAVAIGIAVGLLYLWPLAHYFGDPLLTVHSYTSRDYGAANLHGPHGTLFGWPFHGIIVGTMLYPAPWTNLILSFFWIALVIAGTVAMFQRSLRQHWHNNPAEAIFSALYILAIFSYDYLVWARGNFIRFSIPVLPIIFFALLQWLPKDRRMIWFLSVISPVLAACSVVGIKNVHLR